MTPHFQRPFETIQWAREAVGEFDSSLRSFFEGKPCSEVTEIDPQTGNRALKLRLTKPLPGALARKATEALNNIRHSFDQMLFAGCAAIGKTPKRDIHFPWRANPADLEALLARDDCKIPSEFWDVIRREEPYPTGQGYSGGDDQIRELAKIANGKHTIGLSVTGMVSGITQKYITGVGNLSLFTPTWDPVNNEIILLVYGPGGEIHCEYQVAFQVGLDETEPLRDIPATALLNAFADRAERFGHALMAKSLIASRGGQSG